MKLMLALVLACTLAACGSQEIAAKQEAAPQQETAPQQAAICAEPMGISVEKLLLNIDAGLKSIGAPSTVQSKNIEENECGYQIVMMTDFGAIQVGTNPQQEVLRLSTATQLNSDLSNLFATIQTITAIDGTEKMGQTEIGNLLVKTIGDMAPEVKQSGNASKDFEYKGKYYSIMIEGNNLVMLVRKI